MLFQDLVKTMEVANQCGVNSWKMISSVRGSLRCSAIFQAEKVLLETDGEPPIDPTNENYNRLMSAIDQAKADRDWRDINMPNSDARDPVVGLRQICMVLGQMDDEFGVWEKDEGVEGSIQYLIDNNTPADNLDEIDTIFGDKATPADEAVIRNKARSIRLDAFKDRIVDLIEETISDVSEGEEDEPDALIGAILKSKGKMLESLKLSCKMGHTDVEDVKPLVKWLRGLEFIAKAVAKAVPGRKRDSLGRFVSA